MAKIRELIHTIQIKDRAGSYTCFFYRDTRAKRMNLKWKQGHGAIVVLPKRTRLSTAKKFVNASLAWVQNRRELWQQRLDQPHVPELKPGGHVLYRGKTVPIETEHHPHQPPAINFSESRILVINPGEINDPFDEIVIELMKRVARDHLVHVLRHYQELLEVEINRIAIRNQRSRWGSWSTRKNINLNWRLIMLPDHLSRYIILHELIHSRHPDHSRGFWAALESVCPGCKNHREELKNHAYLLALFR